MSGGRDNLPAEEKGGAELQQQVCQRIRKGGKMAVKVEINTGHGEDLRGRGGA